MSLPGTLPFSTKSLQLNNNNNHVSNNMNNSSSSSNNNNISEGEQSPPGINSSLSSAHDFSVFANVHIQGNSGSTFSQSQVNLHSIPSSYSDFSDTMSMRSLSMAPELPKRSNSIISLTNNSISTDIKPVISPRSSADVTSALHKPIVSPKLLESLNEESSSSTSSLVTSSDNNDNAPPAISPRHHPMSKSNMAGAIGGRCTAYDDGASTSTDYHSSNAYHHHIHGYQPVFPPSPKLQNSYNSDLSDVSGFPPISPHVNVPNVHAFNHHVPPPLPPRRREKKEIDAIHLAQIRQAPDAPEVSFHSPPPPPTPQHPTPICSS